jgi:hypothetical protein
MSDPLARLEQIEVEINELYVSRLVFSAAKVKRLLAEIRALKAEIAALVKESSCTRPSS